MYSGKRVLVITNNFKTVAVSLVRGGPTKAHMLKAWSPAHGAPGRQGDGTKLGHWGGALERDPKTAVPSFSPFTSWPP